MRAELDFIEVIYYYIKIESRLVLLILYLLNKYYTNYCLTTILLLKICHWFLYSSSKTHTNNLAHITLKLSEMEFSHFGLFFQAIKTKYTGIPDKIKTTPTPTSHGLT